MGAQAATATINVIDSTLLVDGVTTLTVGGKTYTFVSASPVGDQIQIAATDPLTAANIAIKVSTDTATTLCLASAALDVVTLTANSTGTAGNSIALSETAIPTALTVVAFAGGANDTDYATVAELYALVGMQSGETVDTARLQRLLNTAARLFDRETRGPHVLEGTEVYAANTGTRYFDDAVYYNYLDIHDLLSVTTITRGSTEVPLANYKLLPLNPGTGPYTALQFGAGLTIERDQEDHWYYNNPAIDYITGGIAITGTWGYCTAANRPPAVKEAVLNWAAVIYKTGAVSMSELMQMITTQNPNKIMAANVVEIVRSFKRTPRLVVA